MGLCCPVKSAPIQHLLAHTVRQVAQAQFASESPLHCKEELVCLMFGHVWGT